MRKQEGKCKWEYMKPGSDVPGECIGKRGQPECDNKDKNTCHQLAREGKCKWLPSPQNRKTPTGDCLGEAECIGKTRRVCHRMHQQEGKCYFKPAPENTVELKTTIKGVNCAVLDEEAKDILKHSVQETIAEAADEEPEAVNVTLACGSVIVSAVIDLEERIGIMEGEKQSQDVPVNLVEEMESLKGAVQEDLGKSDVKKEVLTKALDIEGVQQAAEGAITITDVQTAVSAPAATKAPPTQAPSSTTTATLSESVQELDVENESAGSLTPSTTFLASSKSKRKAAVAADSAVGHRHAFAWLLCVSLVAVVL